MVVGGGPTVITDENYLKTESDPRKKFSKKLKGPATMNEEERKQFMLIQKQQRHHDLFAGSSTAAP